MTRVSLIVAMWLLLSGAIADAALAREHPPLPLLGLSLGVDLLAGVAVALWLQERDEPGPDVDG
jgi:hypothetical protein